MIFYSPELNELICIIPNSTTTNDFPLKINLGIIAGMSIFTVEVMQSVAWFYIGVI